MPYRAMTGLALLALFNVDILVGTNIIVSS